MTDHRSALSIASPACCAAIGAAMLVACATGSSTRGPGVSAGRKDADKSMPSHHTGASAETPTSPEDVANRWRLTDLYATDEAWAAAYDALEARVPGLAEYRGRLGESAATLADALDLLHNLDRELNRLYSYASKRSDEDTRVAEALELQQKAQRLATVFSEQASFVEPEILALGADAVKAHIAAEPRLHVYAHTLDDILRRAAHTLDAAGERIVASTGLFANTASSVYNVLTNAEVPWPTVTLSDGTEVLLNQAAYTRYRAASNREDRKAIFDAFWGTWAKLERTLGVTLYSQLKEDTFYSNVRNYPSCLARALDDGHVPEAVYRTLIQATGENIETLHRYFKLRGRMLGIEDLRYHDIYPPLVETDVTFPIPTGKKMVVEALKPLGEAYVKTVEKGLADRWMDTFPRPGKRSGAYSSGMAYDVHPFVLMNYNDDYESVSTLMHEWGHAMHSFLANATQPYPSADYSIFVAEVASTFNEALLLKHMLETAQSDDERLYYLGFTLEGLRGTFFRQTMFAEFELRIHELVEKGEALSGKRFTEIYRELVRRYHGHDAGIVTVDDAHAVEWAYVPHFYYNFYVYQYATSIAAASLLARDVLQGEEGAVERYLAVLKSGGSVYPYDLLKEAGVDLASAAPYEALFARMNQIMDDIELILSRKAGS